MNHRERMRMRQSMGAPNAGNGSLHAERSPQDIALHIEQLMMEGLQPSDRHQFGNAVQTELARLLAEHGMPPNLTGSAELGRLAAGSISVSSTPRPAIIGRQVAEAVYRGIGQINYASSNSPGPAGGSKQ